MKLNNIMIIIVHLNNNNMIHTMPELLTGEKYLIFSKLVDTFL